MIIATHTRQHIQHTHKSVKFIERITYFSYIANGHLMAQPDGSAKCTSKCLCPEGGSSSPYVGPMWVVLMKSWQHPLSLLWVWHAISVDFSFLWPFTEL